MYILHLYSGKKQKQVLLEYIVKMIHGCFIHLRIVHQTVGPAWMNHLTNCPVYHFATVTDCRPVFEWFNHWFVVVKRCVPNCLVSRGPWQK